MNSSKESSTHLSTHWGNALATAREVAGTQDYPTGALYVVATPIGNLADISLRALHVLALVDAIACEDTRHTQPLLRTYGIAAGASKPLLAVHEHNESEAAEQVIAHLQRGERVAFVSDAGTPAVSDPGARLVALVRAAGLRVIPLPGASSVTAVLSVAGVKQQGKQGAQQGAYHATGFEFIGFLPTKAMERDTAVQALQSRTHALVLLEAPHRIEAVAKALTVLGERQITIGRELTKQFEEIATLAAADFSDWLQANGNRTRGEFALVLHPIVQESTQTDADRILKLLLAELPLKTAVKLASDILGAPKNALYDAALEIKKAQDQ